MSQNSSFSDIFEDGCDLTYDPLPSNLKYLTQLFYMVPGIIIHFRILSIMLFQHRKIYMIQSFFIIFSMQSIASLTQLILDLFIQRVIIYIPQLCPSLYPLFEHYVLFPNIIFSIYNYMRAAKSIIQIFLTVNRMTCYLAPLRYSQIWRRFIPVTIAFITLSPFLVIWNVIISETFPVSIFGGFTLAYTKRVRWASLSMFQMIFMAISLTITVFTTSITLFKMRRLENRLKSSERTLCFASFYMSAAFFSAALFQSYFAFFSITAAYTDLVYFLQGFAFDVLNVGSPIVMVLISGQLRYHVIPVKSMAPKHSTVVSVTSVIRKT
nr:chemosensory receptor [Caenorhabditis elegans]